MLRQFVVGALLLACPTVLAAQRPPRPSVRDSIAKARADSAAAADSIALMKEIERIQNEPSRADTGRAVGPQGGPGNPRLLPDFSAVGDMIADFSPKESTQEDGARFGIREVELAVQAAVDPYFRGDVFLGINDLEGLAIEQAYLTTTSLPGGIEVRLGRYLMPFGKQNTTHRHDLHSVEYPYVIQYFFGPEGLKGTGIYASKVFSPLGFYQELIVTAVDALGESQDSTTTAEPVNKSLGNLTYSARLRNYWDVSEATNFEFSASAITGKRAQRFADFSTDPVPMEFNAISARQTVLGADLTFRWRPLQRGLYRSLIVQGEVMRQMNEKDPSVPAGTTYEGPTEDLTGGYVFARWQLTQRGFVGARFDALQPGFDTKFSAVSGYLEFFPSEFSKLAAMYERYSFETVKLNRILLQATFSLGPHKPHPF